MELQTLKNFIVIAESGNITKAAQVLHISQPALSRQLSALEAELGVTLAQRGSRHISLTAHGTYLLQRAQEIVTMADKTKSDLTNQQVISGDLYIGCGETQALKPVAQALKVMTVQYPQVHIHLFSGSGDELRYKMKSGFLDFALLLDPTNMQEYNFIVLPYVDTWGILMHPTNQLATQQVITPEDVDGTPAIFPRQPYTFGQLENWFGHAIDSQNIIGTYNLLFNAAMLVQADVGIVYCLDHLINAIDIPDLVFRPLAPQLTTKINFVWRKNRPLSSAAEAFLKVLQKIISA
ncbi:LysR family transcriptional regulator [Bombilactobacillus bombi]|uniref:LysR family transcriptional regulator n=1 Tax=Bombilactobacillus bombi TaxID=1303590 RepID=A0A417ZJP9_9LACO|nr:LysR family transcriptional regulator [Bombilactobacillus bombi]RHW52061.1 LysR family transcriptional regulator [Bombilactobacillus bombi]